MKKTNHHNTIVSSEIEKQLNIKFENFEFKLDNWGEVDNYAIIEKNTYVFLECERGQKHPNTNVLKLYPYLEKNPEIRFVSNESNLGITKSFNKALEFAKGKYYEGLKSAILETGIELKKYFPISGENPNELPNEISFS